VGRDAEAGAGFVDRAQPVEIGAAEVVAGGAEGGEPGGGRYVDREELVRLLSRGLCTEEFLGGCGQPADGGHRASPEAGSGEGPEAGSEDEPEAVSEDEPETGPEDEPETGPEDEPETGPEDEPETGSVGPCTSPGAVEDAVEDAGAGDGAEINPLCSAAVEGRGPAVPYPYRSPRDSRAIFSWSLRMPWRRASGRGGQPGT
jgi:hypothetical protein